jgi:MoaA/NifB/PqqE/SkfB family radical SAM enzyme
MLNEDDVFVKTYDSSDNPVKFSIKKFLISKLPSMYERVFLYNWNNRRENTYLNSSIDFINNWYKSKPLFTEIEIETINRCNGLCLDCSCNKFSDKRKFKLMDDALFTNIIKQLNELNFDGVLRLFSNNEPLLDKRIYDRIKYAKINVPDAKISLTTNGKLLTLDNFQKLITGLDSLIIDCYSKEFDENVKTVYNYILNKPDLKNVVKFQYILENDIRSNRALQAPNRHLLQKHKIPCLYPFIQLVIRSDGGVSLCCNDGQGIYTLGDCNKDKLYDIWYNKAYENLRYNTLNNLDNLYPCAYCDGYAACDRYLIK